MKTFLRTLIRGLPACLPVVPVLLYGLLVTSPAGEAANDRGLAVRLDPRVELAAILGRVAGDGSANWPNPPGRSTPDAEAQRVFLAQAHHPASLRVRAWIRGGMTSEMLVALVLSRGPLPDLAPRAEPGLDRPLFAGFDAGAAGCTPGAVDSLMTEAADFARAIDFPAAWSAIKPSLEARARAIESDPALVTLTARLNDFFGEPPAGKPVILPTWYGGWSGPFACSDIGSGSSDELRVVDRAEGAGKITPETSLSWICLKEFARPTVERLGRAHARKIEEMSGYWGYLKQGVAATSSAGWQDCFNAHLYRAIDFRVRPQADAVERELRISSAFEAGLGMIRAIDATITGYDRSRGFYRRFTDYYPTLLEDLAGLEARVRLERPRLGMTVTPTGAGLRVDSILPGHSAEESDLRVGDVILEADLRPVLSEETLAQIVQSRALDDVMKLEVEREGRRIRMDLRLTKGRVEYEFFRPEPVAAPKDAAPRPSDG